MQEQNRHKCPTSFRCEPVDPPEPGTPILFFTPSVGGGGFGEPHKLGSSTKARCKECNLLEPHTHMDNSLVDFQQKVKQQQNSSVMPETKEALIDRAHRLYIHLGPPNRWGHSTNIGVASWLCVACGTELVPLEQFIHKGSGHIHCKQCEALSLTIYDEVKKFANFYHSDFHEMWSYCIEPFTDYVFQTTPKGPNNAEWQIY